MRRALFGLAWVFILLAAAYDSHFAWKYREAMLEWELNPLACWAVAEIGLGAVLAFKFGGLAFAGGLAAYCRRRRRSLAWHLTLAIGVAYGLLSLHYFFGFHRPDYAVANLPPAAPGAVRHWGRMQLVPPAGVTPVHFRPKVSRRHLSAPDQPGSGLRPGTPGSA
jgi:hypothetical protein